MISLKSNLNTPAHVQGYSSPNGPLTSKRMSPGKTSPRMRPAEVPGANTRTEAGSPGAGAPNGAKRKAIMASVKKRYEEKYGK